MARYVRSDFIYDLIPLLPLPQISRQLGVYHKELYLIKVIRILKGNKALNVERVLNAIKKFLKERSLLKIQRNNMVAEDTITDHN